jgi:peptidoglycan biosynthesis protein MviN/MurJ (putative lipid II flippase)
VPTINLAQAAHGRMGRHYILVFLGLPINAGAVAIDHGPPWRAGELAIGVRRDATTLAQPALELISAALALASLPRFPHFSAGGKREFTAALARELGMVTVPMLPATLGLALLATPGVTLLFESGMAQPVVMVSASLGRHCSPTCPEQSPLSTTKC